MVAFVPNSSATNLVHGKVRLVYDVVFATGNNGTYFNHYENGAFTGDKYVASPWFGALPIEDFHKLTLVEAVKLILEKYPDTQFASCQLGKSQLAVIGVPTYWFLSSKGIGFSVDFNGKVSIAQ